VFGQGEDADDTVMILMTDSTNDKDVTDLKQRLIDVANLSRQKIIATYKKYRNIPAYSTYLGSRTVPDFDFAVQCNILYFVLDKKQAFCKAGQRYTSFNN
jgi:type I restriction-modification system DNA methylase subunit